MKGKRTSDEVEIRRATMDYAEGWFEGNPERMARSLHPRLVKRGLDHDPDQGRKFITSDGSKDDMIRYTQQGGGIGIARDKLYYKVDILDLYQDVAMVRCETFPYIDYLQLVKQEGQWLILNVLYVVKPQSKD